MESLDPVWIAVAALLLVLLLAVVVARAGRRKKASPPPTPLSPEDELRALGISDIRPRGAAPAVPAEEDEDEAAEAFAPRPVTTAAAAAAMEDTAPEAAAEPVPDEPDALGDEPDEEPDAEAPAEPEAPRALPPTEPFWGSRSPRAVTELLRSLWTAADAHSVALYHPGAAPGEYVLAHASSHGPSVRHEGHFHDDPFFSTVTDALGGADDGANVTLAGEMLRELPLPHYDGAARLSEAVVQPVPMADVAGVLLVVDRESGAFGPAEHRLVRRYASLLAELLDDLHAAVQDEEAEAEAEAAEAADEGRGAPTRSARPSRRGIIRDEMERARAENRPLALALVARADGEAVLAEGPEAIEAAEAALEAHLRAAPRARRVELFGELQYGVFLYDRLKEVRQWAAEVRKPGAAGAPPPLCIGVAVLGERHDDADALRREANEALIHSYREGGETVALEGGEAVVY